MGGKFFHNCIKGFACLAIALLAMANKPCFADGLSSYYGGFNIDNTPVQRSLVGTFLDSIEDSFNYRTDLSLSFYDFSDALLSSNLFVPFSSNQISSPDFYCNIYELDFSSVKILSLVFSSSNFDNYFVSFNSSNNVYSGLIGDSLAPFFVNRSSFIPFNPLYKGNSFSSTSTYPSLSFSTSYNLTSFPTISNTLVNSNNPSDIHYVVDTLSNLNFSSLLNNYSNFCILFVFDSTGFNLSRSGFVANVGLSLELNSTYFKPIFSSIYAPNYGSISGFASSTSVFSQDGFYLYIRGFSGLSSADFQGVSSYPLVYSNFNPTPSPIPPWRDSELPTPTAYPSVSSAPLPTGIVTDYIPLLDLPSSENTLSNITGIIKEFNSIFSRKVFALGSYTLQVMYYFSGWFKFIFLVPAGVFIAFLIGRLRKK